MKRIMVSVNLSFKVEMTREKFLEMNETVNFIGDINNKKFIDLFAIDKRPLALREIGYDPNDTNISEAEINIIG